MRVLADFREMRAFRDLILLLMQRAGAKLEISKIASEIGVSRETVYSFLSFLEATYLFTFSSHFQETLTEKSGGEIDFIVGQAAFEANLRGTEFDLARLRKTARSLGMKQHYLVTKHSSEKKSLIPALEL